MSDAGLLTADAPALASLFGTPQWGLFWSDGSTILAVDSVGDIEYARDYQLSDYPQEQGAFATYNKVQVPFQAKIGFLIQTNRRDFLNNVEAAAASLQFVTVVTPEVSYESANIIHYGYRRTSRQGVTLIRVEVWVEEVRILSGPSASNTQSTNAASPTQSGGVQASPQSLTDSDQQSQDLAAKLDENSARNSAGLPSTMTDAEAQSTAVQLATVNALNQQNGSAAPLPIPR